MINVTVVKLNNKISVIEATGHSGYAESGSDIVCSAVSALVQNLLLGLTEVLHLNVEQLIDENVPHFMVKLPNSLNGTESAKAQILMQTTYLSLKSVAKDYSKFIKIKEKQND